MAPLLLPRMPLQAAFGQHTGARPPTRLRYDREAAIAYAKAFWDRHCSDGYVAVNKKGTPPYREVDPGREFLNVGVSGAEAAEHATEGRIPWSDLDDCAHFVSCCVGRPFDALRLRPMLKANPQLKATDAPRLRGGGLNIRPVEGLGAPWFYGIVGVPRLVSFLSQPGMGVITAHHLPALDPKLGVAVDRLQAGDVIALSNERGSYTHVVLHDGGGGVFCHTKCRGGAVSENHWRLNTLAHYTCIHIHDDIHGP